MKKLFPILVVVMLFVAVGTVFFAYSAYKDNVDKDKFVPASTNKDTEMEAELTKLDNEEVETKVKEKSKLNDSITIQLVEKTPRDSSYDADYILNFKLKITNHTDKDIKGFIGETYFYDMFGELLYTVDLKYEWDLIPANNSIDFNSGFKLNNFNDNDVRLFNLPFENMKFDYKISSIIFNDGTTISE
ncbi:hypothetical protein ACIQZG_24075 [Lysinibacillus sp. NPDC096418]|uniref:hypothetical protein n=1 Tax=Lysinibacillus sp. NPDC096418 TaxID=3364138 RepID=UPI003825C942